jgi:hypothetical protein
LQDDVYLYLQEDSRMSVYVLVLYCGASMSDECYVRRGEGETWCWN